MSGAHPREDRRPLGRPRLPCPGALRQAGPPSFHALPGRVNVSARKCAALDARVAQRVIVEMDPAQEHRVPGSHDHLRDRLEIDAFAQLARREGVGPGRAGRLVGSCGRRYPPSPGMPTPSSHSSAPSSAAPSPLPFRRRSRRARRADPGRSRVSCEPPPRSRRDLSERGPRRRAGGGASTGND